MLGFSIAKSLSCFIAKIEKMPRAPIVDCSLEYENKKSNVTICVMIVLSVC